MASAGYRAAIYTPDAEFEYALRLAVDAPPELTDAGVRAGDALEAQLIAIAKQVARQAGKRRSESAPPWPRRVLRWKGPGRGGR
jgi:hypothetical protein